MPKNTLLNSSSLTRRSFLTKTAAAGATVAAGSLFAPAAFGQDKPEKITVTGLQIAWNKTFDQDIGPKFEKETGIKVQFEWLPIDALAARLKTQMSSGDGSVDVAWFHTGSVNAIAQDLADHGALLAEFGADDDYEWDDIFDTSKQSFTVGGRLVGVPFRFTTYILHYQPEVLAAAGITQAPTTFAEYRAAGLAVTEKFGPKRFGVGMYGRESEAMVNGWVPFMLSSGGAFYNPETYEILVNKPESVSSLQFYGDLLDKDKVVPPEALTWEWDGLISGAQADRYAMTGALAPYATLMGNADSKTAGKWDWANVPGATSADQARSASGGWAMGVAEASRSKRWAFEFVKMATSKAALKSTTKDGNSPPRNSVMNDPDVVATLKWAPAFAEMAKRSVVFPPPDDPIYATCSQQIRPHVSRVLLGQSTAQEAMDAAAEEWRRTMSRAGLI